jgi:hypothetical protein
LVAQAPLAHGLLVSQLPARQASGHRPQRVRVALPQQANRPTASPRRYRSPRLRVDLPPEPDPASSLALTRARESLSVSRLTVDHSANPSQNWFRSSSPSAPPLDWRALGQPRQQGPQRERQKRQRPENPFATLRLSTVRLVLSWLACRRPPEAVRTDRVP